MSSLLDEIVGVPLGQPTATTSDVLVAIAPIRPFVGLPLGVLQVITDAIVHRVSQDTAIQFLPTSPYGFTTPFQGEQGVVGMGRNSFATLISNIVTSSACWGVKHPVFIVPTKDDKLLVLEGIKRYKRKLPSSFQALVISWQDMPFLKKELGTRFEDLSEYWHSEAAVSILAHELLGIAVDTERGCQITSQKQFDQWYKRGMDPQKRYKIASNGYFSSWKGYTEGGELLSLICADITKKINLFLENQ